MLDYVAWLQRAVQFTERMRCVAGEVRVEVRVAPPLSQDRMAEIARYSRLPIPRLLCEFWTKASGHADCTYHRKMPAELHEQLGIAFPHWRLGHFWGGPEFFDAVEVIELTHTGLDFADLYRDTYPEDARYWKHALPLISDGAGDYVGLFISDDRDDPPVAYFCHEGCDASGIIARTFDEFLTLWERLGYISVNFLHAFRDKQTGLLNPDLFPDREAALRDLLACHAG